MNAGNFVPYLIFALCILGLVVLAVAALIVLAWRVRRAYTQAPVIHTCFECHAPLDKWDAEHNVVHRPDLRHYCLDCWLDVGMYLSDAERRTRVAEVKQARQAHTEPVSVVSESVPVDFERHPPKALEWRGEDEAQQ